MTRVPAVMLTAAIALAVSACGGGNTGAGSAPPTASAPDATAPPTDATQPGTTSVTPPPAQTQPSRGADDGGATGGGEQSVRVPATFTVAASGRMTPPTITVPPFLAVELALVSDDGRPHTLVLRTATPHVLHVAAGGRAAVRIAGLRAGRYAVTLDGRRAGSLVAGGEVGP